MPSNYYPIKNIRPSLVLAVHLQNHLLILLNKLSKKNRDLILNAYFGSEGARYSLTRTHINSCDFSLSNYSYAPIEGDKELENFSIEEDRDDIIPMIRDAMAISEDGFKIIASPWTAPPWMKDNNRLGGWKIIS